VLIDLVDKEGRKGDKNALEMLMNKYGEKCKLLFFRILDELLFKEVRLATNADFSKILSKQIFLKSVLICSIETIFFIDNVRQMQIDDILKSLQMNAFDFWRILNSFVKFDPQMPRVLNNHFREIEIRITSEVAW
jgi:hypothetical protein